MACGVDFVAGGECVALGEVDFVAGKVSFLAVLISYLERGLAL